LALLDKPLTPRDVFVIPFLSNTVAWKFAADETCTRYDNAPADPFQLNATFVGAPAVLSKGETSIGGSPTAAIVVKLHTEDHPLVPKELVALTRQ
jgi:hypothetical protein